MDSATENAEGQGAQAEEERRGLRPSSEIVERAYRFADLSAYPFKKRLIIRAAGLVFYVLIRLIGRSARFEVEGRENLQAAMSAPHVPIYTSWHNNMFLATYFWRGRGIIVMSSKSFDAEYTARFIQRFGYGVAKGSSTRGGAGGFARMLRLLRLGRPAGFTIDGPKGPRHVAKMGAVLLAKKSGNPILPFAVAPARFWELSKSWDKFQVPKPFTRALVAIGRPVFVPPDADDRELEASRDEVQRSLDELTARGEMWRDALTRRKG